MAGLPIQGPSGNTADVDEGLALLVNLGKSTARAGYAVIMSEVDAGTLTGTPLLRSPEVSSDFRTRAGLDTQLIDETFNYAAQNSGAFSHSLTTMTATFATGFLSLNGGAITTINTGALLRSYRVIPVFMSSPTYVEWVALRTQPPQTNNVLEMGVGLVATSNAVLGDGVVFRYDATGVLKGVLAYNGSETFTAAIPSPSDNAVHKYGLSISSQAVNFWIDDVLVAALPAPVGVARIASAASHYAIARNYNVGVAPALAQILRIGSVNATLGDLATGKSWAHQCASAGLSAIQAVAGMTQGQTANMANSAAPSPATLANTTAGYTTLGGQFSFAAVAGSETDYALFGYQVPAAAVGLTGRQLHVTGVTIDSFNTVVAVATTATVLQWALSVGATAVSLATGEAAAAKAPRRVPLGVQSFPVGAAVGQTAPVLIANFDAPYVANPGEFVHIILKMPIGTATATEVFRGSVRLEGYWE